MRETITGTLHVSETMKRVGGGTFNRLLGQIIIAERRATMTEEQVRRYYYPPSYWISGTGKQSRYAKRDYLYKFKSNKHGTVYGALDRTMDGATVTVTATMEEWGNGNGAWLGHPVVESVEPPTATEDAE